MRLEHRCLGSAQLALGALPQCLECGAGVGERGGEALPFDGGIVGFRRGDVERAGEPHPRRPDGDARRRREWSCRSARSTGCASRRRLVERPVGQRGDLGQQPVGVVAAGVDLQLVVVPDAERGDGAEAVAGHPVRAGRPVAQPHVGVAPADRLHQSRRRSGVQPMRVGHADHCRVPLLGRPLGRHRGGQSAECGALAVERGLGLGSHGAAVRPARRGDRGDDETFDERRRAQHDPAGGLRVEQLHRDLGGEHGAAHVDEDDDAGAAVGTGDGARDPGGVGAERPVLEPRGGHERHVRAVQHLASQFDRSLGERVAV